MAWRLFEDRDDAGRRLAERFRGESLTDPVVLAIPRGGVEVALPLAEALGAELDVVLSRKLRSRSQPELALGAVSESGEVYLSEYGVSAPGAYLEEERSHQMAEIERRARAFRQARPRVRLTGRSVIVTDDGIATGSTMMATLRTLRAERPREIIVAVPVASADRLEMVRGLCDRVVCEHVPDDFWAVGQFYRNFGEVTDARVLEVLSQCGGRPGEAHPRMG